MNRKNLLIGLSLPACGIALALAVSYLMAGGLQGGGPAAGNKLDDAYVKHVRPLLKKYCFECHSTKVHKSGLDLEKFESLAIIRKDLRHWQHVNEQVDVSEMPPKGKPASADERKLIVSWVRDMLDTEARARTGDPGNVPMRRLSNAEFDCTIRDLTGVDLRPTKEFPADGAAGEGFTNAAESLSDVTPTLFARYLRSAKEIADHAVLVPDGFHFSRGKTRRDWTDESLARMRKFYTAHTSDGRLVFQPYVSATVRHRQWLAADLGVSEKLEEVLAAVALKEKLNPKYLGILWQTLTDKTPSDPLDQIRARWRVATEKDVGSLTAEIAFWQSVLWKFVPVGSYLHGDSPRQVANNPATSNAQPIKLAVKPAPGQNEVVLYLAVRDVSQADQVGRVVWQRPRFEGAGKAPLLLKDYAQFGVAYEVDHSVVFADVARYLSAAADLAHDRKLSVEDIAAKNKLNPAFLKRWVAVLALAPAGKEAELPAAVPAALDLLDQKAAMNVNHPSIKGWRRGGADLPVLVTNASDKLLQIPGRVPAHKVVVHPTPKEFVAVAWKSPVAGKMTVTARIKHAHPACGNGVAWWLEHRRAGRAVVLGEGALNLGGEEKFPGKTLDVEQGDLLVLAIDPRNGDHTCDLTEINLTVSESAKAGRVWDLAGDIADTVEDGNPHADKHGNKEVWSFVRGPVKAAGKTQVATSAIPPGSILSQWRAAAMHPTRRADADKIAAQVQTLLTGARPAKEKDPDRILFDAFVAADGVILKGLDLSGFANARPKELKYGLPKESFGQGKAGEEANLVAAAGSVIEVRLPAALFRDREFLVEGKLDGALGDVVAIFQVTTAPPGKDIRWNGKGPIVASPSSAAYKRLLAGFDDFRRCFPWHLCFPNVVPTDEIVSLKMFHREDEPLERLFLDAEQKKRIDHLWAEHRFIGQQAIAENNYLPQFIGFVTQDQPKSLVEYFESQRPNFKKRADDFVKDSLAAEPKQLAALTDFASRAYRRPLEEREKADLLDLYQKVRNKKGVSHDEAFRGVLTRVLVTPAFLFRIEKAPPGVKPGPIDNWELATRLSYFLWSSAPDEELRQLAAAGKLRDPVVLAEQTRRMLKDERLRSLAIEFGTQWIHVRDIDNLKEKNEKLFPTFDAKLRQAIYEESILFFQDLFQSDRPVTRILDADYTFLNDTLAKHYGIPGVAGPEWRRVEGVRKFGRGGILGLASVQAKQSGASRTSPVLRGNWVVETLLGEKLPRPPANVPILPDEEGGADKLTTRQQTEKHVSVPSCAVCHVRIDPYGFAFENFDAIGRWRVKEVSGLPVDTRARLKDGTEFEGIDGLRNYLLTKRKDVIVRLFYQKLLGYALGRATALSDTSLIDEMVAALNKNDGRLSAAVLTIVRSPQFRMIRGSEYEE